MDNTSEVSIIISLSAGVLSFLSPCILPLFPSYLTYITGKSFEEIKASGSSSDIRKLTVLHSLFFIIGFSIIFILLGTSFAYLGSFFGIKRIWIERIGGVLIILFGMNISGIFKIKFLTQEKRVTYHKKKANYFSSLLTGMAFSAGWTPCVGPILSSILIYASAASSLPRAIMLLAFYCLGLGVPFFISSLAVNQFLFVFNRFKVFMKFVPVITGIFLILAGALLASGQFSRLSSIFITN